jgi:hypothetical protein
VEVSVGRTQRRTHRPSCALVPFYLLMFIHIPVYAVPAPLYMGVSLDHSFCGSLSAVQGSAAGTCIAGPKLPFADTIGASQHIIKVFTMDSNYESHLVTAVGSPIAQSSPSPRRTPPLQTQPPQDYETE